MSTHINSNPVTEADDMLDDEIVETVELPFIIDTDIETVEELEGTNADTDAFDHEDAEQAETLSQYTATEFQWLQFSAFLSALKPVTAAELTSCRSCSNPTTTAEMACTNCGQPTGAADRATQEAFMVAVCETVLKNFGLGELTFTTNSRGKLVAHIATDGFSQNEDLHLALCRALGNIESAASRLCESLAELAGFESEMANLFAVSRTIRAVHHRLDVMEREVHEAEMRNIRAAQEAARRAAMSEQDRQQERDAKRTDKAIKDLAKFTAQHRTLPGSRNRGRNSNRNGKPRNGKPAGEARQDASSETSTDPRPRRNRRNRRRAPQGNAAKQHSGRPHNGGSRDAASNGEARKGTSQGRNRNKNRNGARNTNHAGASGDTNPAKASSRDEWGRKRR